MGTRHTARRALTAFFLLAAAQFPDPATDPRARLLAVPSGLSEALRTLASVRRTAALRSMAGCEWQAGPDGAPRASIWVAGEFDAVVAVNDERWEEGGSVAMELEGPGGTVERATRAIDRDSRFFFLRFGGAGRLAPGEYTLLLTAKPEGAAVGSTETIFVWVAAVAEGEPSPIGQPQLFRRGPFSGSGWMPTGDPRYRRQERVKVEAAVFGDVTSSAVRLLDRAGHPLPLPMTAGERKESGSTIVSGEVALAPLGVGDYVLETTIARGASTERRYTAIRIVP